MIVKLTISGNNIQGVQLRERIARTASAFKLKGTVKNLLYGDVEVIFLKDEKNENNIRTCLISALESAEKSGLISKGDIEKIEINEKGIDSFEIGENYIEDKKLESEIESQKTFKVVREHELLEIVWALHGAGRVFQSASEKVAEMLNYKKREVEGRIRSVIKELMYVQNNLPNADDLICLKQFIADPLIDISIGKPEEEDVMRMLIEFYYDFLRYKKTSSPSEKELVARIEVLIKKLDSLDYNELINKTAYKSQK